MITTIQRKGPKKVDSGELKCQEKELSLRDEI